MTIYESKILSQCQSILFKYSLKSVTMDDMAREASISKKTLYDHFKDKESLVSAIVTNLINTQTDILFRCREKAVNAVEEIVLQVRQGFIKLTEINQSFFHDVEKYYPEAWQLIIKYKKTTLLPFILTNLNRGIEEEYFRKDIQLPFTGEMRLQQIATSLDPGRLFDKNYQAGEMLMTFTIFYLHAITTTKGKNLIQKYINE